MNPDWRALIAHSAHDVSSLARQALANAQLLQRETKDSLDPAAATRLETIVGSQQKLLRLMQRINRLAEAALADRAALWDETQELDVLWLGAKLDQKALLTEAGAEVVAGTLPEVQVPAKLQQVFGELLHNSLQFRDAARPLRIELQADASDDRLSLTYADNAAGWDPAFTHKLFQPFERLQAGKGGAGLGLATCRFLVEAAGGTISAEPQRPGSRFTIELPVSQPDR
jgi:signal transduction histidine kinase